MSTTIARGRAIGIVVRIGEDTEVKRGKKKAHHHYLIFYMIRLVKLVRLFSKAQNTRQKLPFKENWTDLENIWFFSLLHYVFWLLL